MLAMIGDFEFEMNKKQLDAISHKIDFTYSKTSRIGNNPIYQAVGKSEESFTISGTLILNRVTALDDLEKIGELKEPVVLSFVNKPAIFVLIQSIQMDKDTFIRTGEFVKQNFKCELVRWYK